MVIANKWLNETTDVQMSRALTLIMPNIDSFSHYAADFSCKLIQLYLSNF